MFSIKKESITHKSQKSNIVSTATALLNVYY